jgi:CheY-like chemotaxis protein
MENHAKTLNGLRILVVEDEALVAMMLEDMLLDFGCRIDLAPSIKSALAAIRDHPLDGVLLDMNIHGQQTTAVAEELLSRSVPFLLVTGYGAGNGDPPAIKTAQRLQKPFSQDDLGRRMGEVFGASAGAVGEASEIRG